MVKSFQQWINENESVSYASLVEYLKAVHPTLVNLIAHIQTDKPSTHIVTGTWFEFYGSVRADLKAIKTDTGKADIPVGADGTVATYYPQVLALLDARLKDRADIIISASQFPLPAGVVVTGVTGNFDKTN